MPTVLTVGPFRFFFFAGDRDEPPHIHVQRDRFIAKFWLQPPRLASSGRFSRADLLRLNSLIVEHQNTLLQAWHDYFGHNS